MESSSSDEGVVAVTEKGGLVEGVVAALGKDIVEGVATLGKDTFVGCVAALDVRLAALDDGRLVGDVATLDDGRLVWLH